MCADYPDNDHHAKGTHTVYVLSHDSRDRRGQPVGTWQDETNTGEQTEHDVVDLDSQDAEEIISGVGLVLPTLEN